MICSEAITVYCNEPDKFGFIDCKHNYGERCLGHSTLVCHRLATHRVTSKTDSWPQQYACADHLEDMAVLVAGSLDNAKLEEIRR